MSDTVNYKEIHAYMLKKTQEYYQKPPKILVDAVMEKQKEKGSPVTYELAERMVTSIEIQRLVKEEMKKKWPEFMAAIPSNPLQSQDEVFH